jgi:DNA/RNA endonuclease YhcR with UshA esterase domain
MMKTLLTLLVLSLALPAMVRAQAAATEEPAATETEAAAETPALEAPVVAAEDIAGMDSKVGSEIIVEGVVRNVGKGSNDGITFLNFGDRRSGFVAVAFSSVYDKFPEGFDRYNGQKVRVRGMLEKFRDRQLQIRISTPDQIEIVAGEAVPAATP